MASTQDRMARTRNIERATSETHVITSAATLYVGCLASFDASGTLVNATDAASTIFAGEVMSIVNESGAPISSGTGNADGTVKAVIRYGHQMLLNVGAAARLQANLRKSVTLADNDTVLGATSTNDIVCGKLMAFGSSTSTGWVELGSGIVTAAA